MMLQVWKAVHDFSMIEKGDRVLLGLSGGKDSLALLHILLHLKKNSPPGYFTLGIATVDPGMDSFDPKPLKPYVASLGLPYHFLETPIIDWASSGKMHGDSLCAFCSRMKRGALYSCCRDQGARVRVEWLRLSLFMSAMHNGLLRTMKASYPIDATDVTVIRPLVFVRENALRDYCYAQAFPVIDENCPACFEEPKVPSSSSLLLSIQVIDWPLS
ncbi:hypothetical protein T484DRAFT_1672241 [Baffinella frigidus]|nr:hypothetical protein T484DRAFT_1672241 [Cryptophyta sp. CCMP2293]